MLKIENTEVFGWEATIRGMRNPKNIWKLSDSKINNDTYIIGSNDMKLMKALKSSGTDHRKYLRMITVYADITAPLYWWSEYDTYKVGTVMLNYEVLSRMYHSRKDHKLDEWHQLCDWISALPYAKELIVGE